MVSSKVDFSFNKIRRIDGIDQLAEMLFPNNCQHQRLFHAIFVDLKWSPDGFLPSLSSVASNVNVSNRVLETVRAKMRRLGVIDHVSKFNSKYGYQEGWILSRRFERSLVNLATSVARLSETTDPRTEERDKLMLSLSGVEKARLD